MGHAEGHQLDSDYYYRIRQQAHSDDPIEVSARFIYLNKTCYNGLHRVNRPGHFNVPKGNYRDPMICDGDGIRSSSKALWNATVRSAEFREIVPGNVDFIYCDPPCGGAFTGYASGGFGDDEQRRLRDAALRWNRVGAQVMISNSDARLIRELYGDALFKLHEISAPRRISRRGDGRKPVSELLILTYETGDSR